MKKTVTAVALAGVLVFGTAASCKGQPEPDPDGPTVVELEDCDAEDWKNYDPECGRGPRPMKTAYQKAPTTGSTKRR